MSLIYINCMSDCQRWTQVCHLHQLRTIEGVLNIPQPSRWRWGQSQVLSSQEHFHYWWSCTRCLILKSLYEIRWHFCFNKVTTLSHMKNKAGKVMKGFKKVCTYLRHLMRNESSSWCICRSPNHKSDRVYPLPHRASPPHSSNNCANTHCKCYRQLRTRCSCFQGLGSHCYSRRRRMETTNQLALRRERTPGWSSWGGSRGCKPNTDCRSSQRKRGRRDPLKVWDWRIS
jgi:hypothetical protein